MQHYGQLSEKELLKRLQADDRLAFTEIYNRYREKLLAIAYFHAKEKQTAEDIVQDVMISLWTRRNLVEINTIESYLATAVKFAIFKSIARDKRRRALLFGREQLFSADDMESSLDAKFLQEYLGSAIEKLPLKTRLVFDYSRTHKLPIAEIAGLLNLSPKSVEYHLGKALRMIKVMMKKIFLFFI